MTTDGVVDPGCVRLAPGRFVCGRGGVKIRGRHNCPECGAVGARIVTAVPSSPYYGKDVYCECGDLWQDGYRSPRPFARYWRRDAQRAFEQKWEAALPEGTRVTRDDEGYVVGYITGLGDNDGLA